MAIYYIGAFPPSYGGVTVKNQNLYEALPGHLKVRRIDMNRVKRGDVREILRFGWAMVTGKQYIIGLAGQKNRRQFTKLLHRFRRRAMERSVLLVMGGLVDDMIDAGAGFLEILLRYRRVYVELSDMVLKLNGAGVTNVALYRNGRPRPPALEQIRLDRGPLQCVFFSQIEPEKGVDRILESAKQLEGIQFDFYGRVIPAYQERFLREIEVLENVQYHGVFTGTSESVYRVLNQYDVLLLPTRCRTEGLPGILIEAKIAGIPAVVSDINGNREIITDGTDGFVLDEDTADCLAEALCVLDRDRALLLDMKFASRASAEGYYIDVCAKDVIRALERG